MFSPVTRKSILPPAMSESCGCRPGSYCGSPDDPGPRDYGGLPGCTGTAGGRAPVVPAPMVNDRWTSAAAEKTPSPGWPAVSVQLPFPVNVTVAPLTVQAPPALKVTVSP